MAMEQIEFSLFDYFKETPVCVAAMITDINQVSVVPAVGRKSFAYDCGEELKGARKHLAALSKYSSEWYEALELDPTQAFEAICKDDLIEDFNPEGLREQGFSSESAFAIKLIWDKVSQRPADDPKQREYFVKAINELQIVFAKAYTESLFKEAFLRLKDDLWKAYYSQYDRKLKEDPSLINYVFWYSLGEKFKSIFSTFGRGKVSGSVKLFAKAFTSEEGKEWKWTEGKIRSSSHKTNKDRWERQVPEEVVRLSKEASGVSKPGDLIEQYGYRGVQFGNWVEDASGRYHVLCCGDAHADLATILNIPRHALSFYGRLGIAFGARGSGSASAHFEPDLNVFNYTKYRGGGAKAHEWAHALDFNLNSYSHDFKNGKKAPLSGSIAGSKLPYMIESSFKKLMEKIKKGNGLLRVEVPEVLPTCRSNYVTSVLRSLERNEYDVTKALAALKGYYIKPKMWEDIGFTYCRLLRDAGREVPKEFFVPTEFSNFFNDAKERGAYWRRDHELFARAFEAWIEDELTDRGMTNSYLVSGTRFRGPYPHGEERLVINEAFRSWWGVLLESGILHDEQIWRRN